MCLSEFKCGIALDPWWPLLPSNSAALKGWQTAGPLLVLGSQVGAAELPQLSDRRRRHTTAVFRFFHCVSRTQGCWRGAAPWCIFDWRMLLTHAVLTHDVLLCFGSSGLEHAWQDVV